VEASDALPPSVEMGGVLDARGLWAALGELCAWKGVVHAGVWGAMGGDALVTELQQLVGVQGERELGVVGAVVERQESHLVQVSVCSTQVLAAAVEQVSVQ